MAPILQPGLPVGALVALPAWSFRPETGQVVLLTFLHLLAFSLVTLHCLRNRREPTSTLLWIALSWAVPILGPLLFLFFGINRLPAKAWHFKQSSEKFLSHRKAREEQALPLAYWRAVHGSLAAEPTDPFARQLNKAMDAILPDYPLLAGNAIEPLVCGDEAYPRMLAAIRGARHHIHLQTFILANDPVGRDFLEALAERAREGIRVRLLYDRFGSTHAILSGLLRRYGRIPNFSLQAWTQASFLKRQFPFHLRNHRKLLVVDGVEAFTGGVNIGQDNVHRINQPPIRDYHFAIRGPIVQELQYAFLRDWYYMTDEDAERLLTEHHFPHINPSGDSLVRVVSGGPSEADAISDTFFLALTAAHSQIIAVTPYLVPTYDIIQAFRTAARRGVDVRIVVPARNNHFYAGMASRALYDDLLSAGIRLFERRPPFMHAKALLIDGSIALVGTANLDVRSLHLNYETNLAVCDPVFADQLKEIVLEDIALSDEINLTAWRQRPIPQRIVENFCHLLTPVL